MRLGGKRPDKKSLNATCNFANLQHGENFDFSHLINIDAKDVTGPLPTKDSSSTENQQIPHNIVNLNVGNNVEISHFGFKSKKWYGKPKPPIGDRGDVGERGNDGSMGKCDCETKVAKIKANLRREIMKSIAPTSCKELKENQGVVESGYYLLRKNDSMAMKHVYCAFE